VARFQQGALPEDVVEITVATGPGGMGLAHALKAAQLVPSTSEAMRQLKQGAVRVDGERVEDATRSFEAGNTHVFQVGKRRIARVTFAMGAAS
jgi:tyrosyl-tRNA synthetase